MKQFYAAWLIISIIWLWGTLFVAGFYPLIDGREQLIAVARAVWVGKGKPQESGTSSDADVGEVVVGDEKEAGKS